MFASDTAILRAVLQGWHRDSTRRIARQRKVGSAVIHAWMSLVSWVLGMWKAHLSEMRRERQAMAHASKMWMDMAMGRGWNTWIAYAAQRVHYRVVAARIASVSASSLASLTWSAVRRMQPNPRPTHTDGETHAAQPAPHAHRQ